jgi:hypothetical protein
MTLAQWLGVKPGTEWIALTVYVGCAIVFSLLAIGTYLLVRDTRRRDGIWGINFQPLRCPRCATPAPAVRKPTSWRQAIGGGFSCACGCEVDKWGRAIATTPSASTETRSSRRA